MCGMPPKPITRIDGLELDEISLVKRGANQHADVVLFKSAEPGGSTVTLSDILKAIAALTDADRAEVAKAVTVAKVADPLADLPADHPIRKRLDEAETKSTLLAKRFEELEEREAVTKAIDTARATLPSLQTPEITGALARRVEKAGAKSGDATLGADVLGYLAKLEPLVKRAASSLSKSHGVTAGAEVGVDAEIETMVKELRKGDSSLGYAEAYTQVIKGNPDLYDRLNAEKGAS